jgi:hypothetical protein
VALKFLLHFVGDLHQPLHAADDHDAAATRSSSRANECTGVTFITIRMSSSWSGWELTRVEWRQI